MSGFAELPPEPGQQPPRRDRAGLTIRPSRLADVAAIAAVAAEREDQPLENVLAGVARFHLEGEMLGDSLLLVAEYAGTVVGFGKASRFRRPEGSGERTAPEGWYLNGVTVRPSFRRRGAGAELTRFRLQWIARRAREAFYIAQARNLASIALHRAFGFSEVTREFEYPGAVFEEGGGILFRCDFCRPRG